MTTKLQQALSKVQSPKIPISRVQGATYQAQAQSAEQVQQTNYSGQLNKLMQMGTDAYGQVVQNRWTEAEEEYAKVSADPNFDEKAWLEERAKEESEGFFGAIRQGINETMGVDPNYYRKAVAMNKRAEREMFEIDKEIQVRSQAGHYNNLAELEEDRDALRKSAMDGMVNSYGIEANNPFMLKGMARNNEESLKMLATTQAVSTYQQLKTEDFQNGQAEINKLVDKGVQNVNLYSAKFKQVMVNRSPQEQQEFAVDMVESFAKSGNVNMTLAWLDAPQEVFGGKSLGEVLPNEISETLVGQAEEAQFTMNQELMDKWSRTNEEILIKAYSDPVGAMKDLDRQGAYLETLQPSNITTVQARQLQELRNNILRQQGIMNREREVRIQKQREEMAHVGAAKEAIMYRQGGGVISLLDNPNFNDKQLDLAFQSMLQDINDSSTLTPVQKQEETIKLISIAPDSASIRGAVKESVQIGLQGFQSAMMNMNNGILSDEPPKEFNQVLEMYRSNPTGFGLIAGQDNLAQLQAMDAGLKQFGWEGFAKASAKGSLMDKDQKKALTAQVMDKTQDLRLDANQMQVLNISAQKYVGMGYDFDEAISKGIKDYEKTVSMVDGYPLRNSTLAPNGNSQEIPVIQNAIQDQINVLKEKMPKSMFMVNDDEFGNIYIEDVTTGRTWQTKAHDVWQSYLLRNADVGSKETPEEAMERTIKENVAKGGKSIWASPYDHKTYKQANPWNF